MEKEIRNNPKKTRRRKQSEFEIYASFLALPSKVRRKVYGFHTDQEFAEEYHLCADSLSDWKKDREFWKLRDKHLIHFKKYTPDVLEALYDGVLEKKSAAEVMAWFRLVEGYEDGHNIKGEIEFGQTIAEVFKNVLKPKRK